MFGWFRKSKATSDGPDPSGIDSREKTDAMFRGGHLTRLPMRPLEFGGEDHPLNVLYVPVWVAEMKSRTDNNVIAPLAAEGKVKQYKVAVEYQGKSVIPIAIRIVAWEPGEFSTTINIWGEALKPR